jgi:hypothetical protein
VAFGKAVWVVAFKKVIVGKQLWEKAEGCLVGQLWLLKKL